MSRHHHFVLGFHGCERDLGLQVIRGEVALIPSDTKFDWMGKGIYFWENDPLRAYEWALKKKGRNHLKDPFVIGAVIDLGNCLDLLRREDVEIVRSAYDSFKEAQEKAGLPMPINKKAPMDDSPELVLRFLDCAVLDYLHSIIDGQTNIGGPEPYDTVRALFDEGSSIFNGSKLKDKNHSQIAVRNGACIKGYFYPLGVANIPSIDAKPGE